MPLLTTRSARSYGFGSLVTVSEINSYESIATVAVGSGGQSYIEFNSIPSGYKHLQIRATMMCSTVNNMFVQVGNGSIDTGASYSWHQLYGTNSNFFSNGSGAASFGYVGYNHNPAYPNPSIIDFIDYANTNKYKTWKTFSGSDVNASPSYVQLWSGNWRSTLAIDTIRITPGSGTFTQHGSFALYGIKG